MRPSVIAFDVNETLSDMSPLGARFVEVGASATVAPLWFASVLRDGFALTAAGENPAFADVVHDVLVSLLSQVQLNRSVDEAAGHVMDGFATLEVHADVASGVEPARGGELPPRDADQRRRRRRRAAAHLGGPA